jgi:hypothetical protein
MGSALLFSGGDSGGILRTEHATARLQRAALRAATDTCSSWAVPVPVFFVYWLLFLLV